MQKDISLFGYGKTTKALSRLFGGVHIYDDNCHKPFVDNEGNKILPTEAFEPEFSSLEIPSPSFNPNHMVIKRSKNLVSEYDYFASTMPFSIWISGSNGKTTTTQMLEYLLQKRDAVAGGNIGTPLAELDSSVAIWILESSSYTLHYTHIASPNIYLLLPITPDHLSWHGSFEAYEASKLKPLATMQEGEVAIVPKKYANYPTKAMLITYETSEDLATYFGFDCEAIEFKGGFLLDALLAMAVDKILFDSTNYETINRFRLDAHRQERLIDAKGRVWINDSKATNVDSTLSALDAFKDKTLYLIVGGDDKGVDLTPLFSTCKELTCKLFCIGSNEKRLLELAQHYDIEAIGCQTLLHAIKKIDALHTQKSVALLSPAAASLDQFSSYIDRGEQFKQFIKELR